MLESVSLTLPRDPMASWGPSDPQGWLSFQGGSGVPPPLVTRQSEDSRRATHLIGSHRLYQHRLSKKSSYHRRCKTGSQSARPSLRIANVLNSPNCTGSCRSACRGAMQPCSARPATSRPAHRPRPGAQAISIKSTHLSSSDWNLGQIGQSFSDFLVKPYLDH